MGLLQMERLRGGDEKMSERGRSCPLSPWLSMVNTPSKSSHVGYAIEASEILDRRSFRSSAILMFFSLNHNALSTVT